MGESFRPKNAAELEELVKWAAAEREPLEVVGTGTKTALGRQVQGAHTLALSELKGIVDYEPSELVLTAKAGTPLAEIESLLESEGQELAFEPVDYGPVLGGEVGKGTFGGALAANLAGPRRLKAGAARDHVLGLQAVAGRGELFKAGGRVVKNVTGYDLARAFCSSWGTLAVASEITVKVAPKAAQEKTLCLFGLDGQQATNAMSAAMGSSAEVSSAAYIPPALAASVKGEFAGTQSVTALRLEGIPASVEYRIGTLKRELSGFGAIDVLEADGSRKLWRSLRQLDAFTGSQTTLWRVSVAPTNAESFISGLSQDAVVLRDWAGGLLWVSDPAENDGTALREALRKCGGGHATLVRGSPTLRASAEVFQPLDPGLAALTRRLKQQFDPHGILNPGRMYPGV
ncbi:glycolate oxidase subunit GlcE [Pseudovibrio exalbescens]|uniref:glycolate oxidase subunit GlcE n=1 Tax=Pseudovibrio exalbescens TaxID=197461 RepID=UPI0023651085|nr:glycolate oxidase subunit GlcE [Pseudovibrio exalbescens]MDD7911375.1 glycolate oxidase subunit GlcE [Pseudovibrio exalbescens]